MQANKMLPTYVFGNVECGRLGLHWNNMRHVVDELGKVGDIEVVTQGTGRNDLVIRLNNHNPDQVYDAVKKIRGIQGFDVTDVHKHTFASDL